MTENNRFDGEMDYYAQIYDNEGIIWALETSGDIKEFCKLLNKIDAENKELKKELNEFKEYVFSDEKILCYSCVNCISKGIYEVECSEKGKVDVHSTCFLYWKNEVEE